MTNIKGISAESAIGQVKRGKAAAPQTPEEIKKEQSPEKSPGSDTLQVNQKQREITQLVENARLLLDELPDVRPDRVEQAKQRLQEGFYQRPEVREEIAQKILDEFSTLKTDQNNTAEQSSTKRTERAKSRLSNGYYDQPEILDETARRILKKNF